MERPVLFSQWPESEKPRERLFHKGVEALSDVELLAILLGTGLKAHHVLHLAEQLIQHSCGIHQLGNLTIEQLLAFPGIGMSKAARIVAACELGRRRERVGLGSKPIIHTAADAVQLIRPVLRDLDHENFLVLLLDAKNRVIGEKKIGSGTVDEVVIYPREVLKLALNKAAAAIIIAHNHPSGDPHPSSADLALTQRLWEAARIIGIRFLDHIIVGERTYISLAEKGYLKQTKKECKSNES